MKKYIGLAIARIGARLWVNGGFQNDDAQFEKLTVLGKIGYNLFIKGLLISGVTKDDMERLYT